ncbi:splicing factor U2AF family SnRNP auxilary factor large subunit, RRM domain-containing protein [Toxoplasma gondii TgCatPRC2]|uniref:Splicing factor U2AF family SnRNP auxilary factor large subunit, RRM domain-containing protein n=1 Tax=Toxoplasma gondii TgCatPRC2 TaxID=1130821 RepID=A0A151HBY6_TOXGO|nr:splicing factor U2AF family SnRNP auxilary factor large subunit, RRM domain-containing protein [Toxoplasma gondii TgCatPRC2]
MSAVAVCGPPGHSPRRSRGPLAGFSYRRPGSFLSLSSPFSVPLSLSLLVQVFRFLSLFSVQTLFRVTRVLSLRPSDQKRTNPLSSSAPPPPASRVSSGFLTFLCAALSLWVFVPLRSLLWGPHAGNEKLQAIVSTQLPSRLLRSSNSSRKLETHSKRLSALRTVGSFFSSLSPTKRVSLLVSPSLSPPIFSLSPSPPCSAASLGLAFSLPI